MELWFAEGTKCNLQMGGSRDCSGVKTGAEADLAEGEEQGQGKAEAEVREGYSKKEVGRKSSYSLPEDLVVGQRQHIAR